MTLEELKKAIMALSAEDLAKFRKWFWKFEEARSLVDRLEISSVKELQLFAQGLGDLKQGRVVSQDDVEREFLNDQ